MKVNELRIFNYILEDYSGEMIVSAIHDDKYIGLRKSKNLPEGLYDVESLKPIPITEEWLLKFGIDIINDNYFGGFDDSIGGILWSRSIYILQQEDKFFLFYDIDDYFYSWKDIEIKSVHQLQNLYFALTGEELILK